MKVKEIMVKDVDTIKPDENAKAALSLLFKMQISGLPVVDSQGKLVGMFTEKDVLKNVLPSYLEKVGRFVYEENPKSIKKKFEDLANLAVSQLMYKEVVSTGENSTLCDAARVMLTQKARRLPVIDKSCKMVGIVARTDILKALAKESENV